MTGCLYRPERSDDDPSLDPNPHADDAGAQMEEYRARWEMAMDEALDKLVSTTELSGFMFVGIYSYSFLQARQEHLACFFPGATILVRGQTAAYMLFMCDTCDTPTLGWSLHLMQHQRHSAAGSP